LTLLNRAIELATLAHGKINQVRNGSGKPYIEHPIRVANTIVSIVDNRVTENTIAAAYLHDVLEDTPTTEEEILAATNDHVLQLVKELTNPSKNFVFKQEYKKLPKGSVRAMKKQMDRDHIKTVSWEAKLIKLADRIDNVNDMEGMDKDFCEYGVVPYFWVKMPLVGLPKTPGLFDGTVDDPYCERIDLKTGR
jgi:(p)ppGpp synthase/HD superfamily hydrolase